MPKSTSPLIDLGLVLSGGGARGIAHAGVLKALDELGIKPGFISGTSSGAIVAAFYASGISPDAIIEILSSSSLFEIKGISFDFKGLMKTDVFRKILRKNMQAKTFEDLNIPISVCTTDFNNAKSVYFHSGELIEPIVASSAIPLVFSPVIIKGHTMVDGGLMNNFPVEPVQKLCKKIIGIHVNPLILKEKPIGITRVLERCFHMAIANTVVNKKKYCDVFIEPRQLGKFGVFDTKYAKDIADIGYRETMSLKEDILKINLINS